MIRGFGGAEMGQYGGMLGAKTVVSSPALAGSYSYEVDAVNGDPITETYGPGWGLEPTGSDFILVAFTFHLKDAAFDTSVSIAELGDKTPGEPFARRVKINQNNRVDIVDKDEDTVGNTGNGYLAVDTDYPMLWYVDLRSANTRDILWVWKAGAWDTAIDVSGHGDANPEVIENIRFGTNAGKGLPSTGGPFYVDECVMQTLNESPNDDPFGSFTTKLKMPTANGTDLDFDTGTGTNPDWQDVDEIPPDEDTTYDEGDVTGDRQSYAIADADVGDVPIAVAVVGVGARSGGGATSDLRKQVYIYDGVTRDYGRQSNTSGYGNLENFGGVAPTAFNDINGATITEALFNSLEAGVEIISATNSAKLRLTQIALEYIVEGPYPLPDDFPTEEEQTASRRRTLAQVV